MTIKNNVVVFLEVFNEASRIESCCEFFKWADELVVVDKSSTDNTVELARRYTSNVIVVPYTNTASHSIDVVESYVTSCEWFFFVTASSAIEPDLVDSLVKLTTSLNFNYDVISLPLKMYVLGFEGKSSPWNAEYKNTCIRRSVLKLSKIVHMECLFESDRIYKGLLAQNSYLYHFTHRNVDTLFERHIRYTKQEAHLLASKNKDSRKQLFIVLKELIASLFHVIVRKRLFLKGWNGIAISLAYVSYSTMKFLYLWESTKEIQSNDYNKEIEKIKILWRTKNALRSKT
jgi:glycosyltransferase involved in cell wall biosynthesis